jgi:hypothetical protein
MPLEVGNRAALGRGLATWAKESSGLGWSLVSPVRINLVQPETIGPPELLMLGFNGQVLGRDEVTQGTPEERSCSQRQACLSCPGPAWACSV